MTATNHTLVGSLIGAILPLPTALPAAFASHFLMDAFPHYGIPKIKRNRSSTYQMITFGDMLIAMALMLTAILFHKWSMLAAGLVAFSPDLLWVVYYLTHHRDLNIRPKNHFMRWHIDIQQMERSWGIFVELLIAAITLPLFIIKVAS